jgi:hypothetical protein
MQLNILHPKKAVAGAFEKPNLVLGIILVLIAGSANVITSMALGLSLNNTALAINSEILAIIRLLFFVVVLAILSLIQRRQIGNIAALVSAISLTFLVNFIATILFIVFQLVLFPRTILETIVTNLQSGKSAVEIVQTIQTLPGIEGIGIFILLVAALALVTLLLNFLILFFTVRNHLGVSRIAGVILTLLIALLTLFVPFV